MGMGIFSGGVAAMVDIAARRQRRPFKEAQKMFCRRVFVSDGRRSIGRGGGEKDVVQRG